MNITPKRPLRVPYLLGAGDQRDVVGMFRAERQKFGTHQVLDDLPMPWIAHVTMMSRRRGQHTAFATEARQKPRTSGICRKSFLSSSVETTASGATAIAVFLLLLGV